MKVTMDKKEDKKQALQEANRFQLIQEFAQIDERTREERVDRYLEIDRQKIIGEHHFAHASTECIHLYTHGYFIATVMTTQAVNEGILKFVAERNNIQKTDYCNLRALLKLLVSQSIFSRDCFEASKQIYKSFRNDVHHMNPKVETIDFQELAKKNIQSLAVIERELWSAAIIGGELMPFQPKYWDINPDGTAPTYLRTGI